LETTLLAKTASIFLLTRKISVPEGSKALSIPGQTAFRFNVDFTFNHCSNPLAAITIQLMHGQRGTEGEYKEVW
jgi:hypothetical protein